MAINYAKDYSNLVDEVYTREGVTRILETSSENYKPLGASQILVNKLTVSGAYDYNRATGWVAGSVGNTWETLDLTMDRGIKIPLDVMDSEESKIEMGRISTMFVKEKLVPEMDLFRFTKMVADKGAVDVAGVVLTFDDVIEAINVGLETMDGSNVTKQGRIIYVSDEIYYKMIKSGEWINNRPVMSNGAIDLSISSYNGSIVIPVNQNLFNTAATFGAGANVLTGDAINFMIVDPKAVIAVIKHSSAFLFSPGEHTEGDNYLMAVRSYHGLNLLENKTAGVYVHTK